MTVDTINRKIKYMGDGVTTNFTIPFPFFRVDSIKAQIKKKDELVIPFFDFDISGVNDDDKIGVYAITAEPVPQGAQIMFYRETALTQETDYKESANLSSETLERDFDNCIMQTQELSEELGRCLKLDMFDPRDSDITKVLNACADARIQASHALSSAGVAKVEADRAVDIVVAFDVSAGITGESFDINASQKTATYDQNHADKLSNYNVNDLEKLDLYNKNHTDKFERYNTNDLAKVGLYNQNHTNKLSDYNANDTGKLNAYNTNTTNKLNAYNSNDVAKTKTFNDNAVTKQTAVMGEGSVQFARVHEEGNTQFNRVKSQGEVQISAIQTEGGVQVELATTQAELASTSAINAEASAVIARDEANRASEIAGSMGDPMNRDLSNPTEGGALKLLPPQSTSTHGQVLKSTSSGAAWGSTSAFILLSAYPFNMDLTGDDAKGWALMGSMVTGQNAVESLPILTQAYESGLVYGTGTIYAGVTGLKKATTLKKGLLIAPYTASNKTALDTLWNSGKEANVWLLDTVNARFMCPRTRNWTAGTSGVNDFIAESLPNIKGRFKARAFTDGFVESIVEGALYKTDDTYTTASSYASTTTGGLGFDASRSSPTYKDVASVQQNASTVYVYYRIYDAIKSSEDIVVNDLTQILTDVQALENAKANTDFSNVNPNQSFKDMSISWGMPDYSRGVGKVWGVQHTAESSGFVYFYDASVSYQIISITIDGVQIRAGGEESVNGSQYGGFIPIAKGSVYTVSGGRNTQRILIFYQLKGV